MLQVENKPQIYNIFASNLKGKFNALNLKYNQEYKFTAVSEMAENHWLKYFTKIRQRSG